MDPGRDADLADQHQERVLSPLRLLPSLVAATLAATPCSAADIKLSLAGRPSVVFDSSRQGCAPIDVPDMNARAFRDASGGVTMFALHYVNRPLRGPDLDHLKIDCHVSLDSADDADPARYAGLDYVAATWTRDGRDVSALVHNEYHADQHGRCRVAGALACWFNTILAFHSKDAGQTFVKASPLVVASAPFTQDVEQGRHRGFLEPSNMFSDGRYVYAFAATTGWSGQDAGACLFRTPDPSKPALWRAYDGSDFTVRYGDPYRRPFTPKPCQVIQPFEFAVGAVVRDARSKVWIAVFQAPPVHQFPVNGFYYATSMDLIHWSLPRLLLAGQTLFSDLCKGGPLIINYPSVLDAGSPSRNFDAIADKPMLYFVAMQVKNCATTTRTLMRQPLEVTRIAHDP